MAQNKQTHALPPASAPTLWATWVWRLVLAAVSNQVFGLSLRIREHGSASWRTFPHFTEIFHNRRIPGERLLSDRTSVMKGSNRYRLEGNHGWFRGAATSMTILTGIVFAALLGAQYPTSPANLSTLRARFL